MPVCDKSAFYVDFTDRENLTTDEKNKLEQIQSNYRPIERVDFLVSFRLQGKITTDDYETMTGVPYDYE